MALEHPTHVCAQAARPTRWPGCSCGIQWQTPRDVSSTQPRKRSWAPGAENLCFPLSPRFSPAWRSLPPLKMLTRCIYHSFYYFSMKSHQITYLLEVARWPSWPGRGPASRLTSSKDEDCHSVTLSGADVPRRSAQTKMNRRNKFFPLSPQARPCSSLTPL